jgi:nucleotide-binding universal stress UspA family protein
MRISGSPNTDAPQAPATHGQHLPLTPDKRRVLALTDFSVDSRCAAMRAGRIAREIASGLSLLHVRSDGALAAFSQWAAQYSGVEPQPGEHEERELNECAGMLRAKWGIPVDAVLGEGSVMDTMLAKAGEIDPELIVVGARGTGNWRRLMLGMTSERLLRRSLRPVLVVRQPASTPYRRVLVALDFSQWSLHSIALARSYAPAARLTLFNAFEVPVQGKLHLVTPVDAAMVERYRQWAQDLAMHSMQSLTAELGLESGTWKARIVEGNAARELLRAASGCDLVVVGKHGHSFTDHVLLGGVTTHVLAGVRCDVLVSTARSPPAA